MKQKAIQTGLLLLVVTLTSGLGAQGASAPKDATSNTDEYQYAETRDLVRVVNAGADLLRQKGEAAFVEFRAPESRWRQAEAYIFVLDLEGTTVVHPDPAMEGKMNLDLKDINGKPIIRGLIHAATVSPAKPDGWYHYQWPVPGGLLARWKSTYVRLVTVPSGARYIVASGIYNDRMEKSFVVDAVKDAVAEIGNKGEAAFKIFHDPTGPFIAKDAYIFIIDTNGVELVNPAFPNLEGRNILHMKDTQGKQPLREMIKLAQTAGQGWVDYMWPKPGESVSTLKSAYISKAQLGAKPIIVGCGVYLADAPKEVAKYKKMAAPDLMALVRDGAASLQKQGENAYPEFRQKGSKWFSDNTYLFVRTMDEKMVFHAADPSMEGRDMAGVKDVLGRPYGKMFAEAAKSPAGEGWVHYMYPEPGDIFPAWKSTFVKRVTLPSGQERIIGCGIYNMDMDEAFIEDVVNRAAALVSKNGKEAFGQLRDKTGPYVFLDTYVFVTALDGTEMVNPAQPSLEGKNLMNLADVNGKLVIRDCIELITKSGSGWLDYYWYKPGDNTPARKHTYVRKAEFGNDAYLVGSGFYPEGQEMKPREAQKTSSNQVKPAGGKTTATRLSGSL